MKQTLSVLLAILLLTISCKKDTKTSDTTPLKMFADSIFQAGVDSAQIAGAAVLVYQNGEAILNHAYGFASLELSAPMPEEANFEIGSVTKQFTAAAILKLVEEKKLSLKDDFTKYMEFDTKGKKITIANLLNHTSGIASYTEIPEFWDLSIESHPRDSLVKIIEKNDFLFETDEALIYNNSAYFFLGLIIEKVTEKSYEEYLQKTFFEPLGMHNTNYCSNSEVIKNKVYGYNFTPNGLQQKPYLNHIWPYAAGSLCSTTEDLLIWMRAVHERKVLSDVSYNSLITPDLLKDGTEVRYAKGLVNFSSFGNHQIAHGGGIHGFLSETRYFPDEDLYIICLVNTTGPQGAGYFADAITWQLLKKQENIGIELDIDIKKLEGKYSGSVRGSSQTMEVKSIPNGITLVSQGRKNIDTLKTYIGNNTWKKGNQIITIKNNEYRMDQIYGYYILKKDN